ncbi:MAG: DUF1080 domain-containing protein [Planctomycetes bacterium]|nr:DUF1080 domain-containing protein [Planctomycetota bacterium]
MDVSVKSVAFFGLLFASLAISGCSGFQHKKVMVDLSDETGFESLFDGKSFGKWKPNERPENWSIKDGAIVGAGPRSHLYYMDEEFQNFIFRAQVMINTGGNSGIFFHSAYQDEGWPSVGVEGQVCNTGRDPTKTGSIWGIVRVLEIHAPDNEWFDYQIKVEGNTVQTAINGRVLADYIEPPGIDGGRKLRQAGLFALQCHDPESLVKYRHIRVKRLPAK